MTTYGLPLFLEDSTGLITNSDFADIYDRSPFYRLSRTATPLRITSHIFELWPSSRSEFPRPPAPTVTMEFGTDHSLGMITIRNSRAVAMDRYLRRAERGGSSLTRKFRASDGIEYMWGFRTVSDQEWTCTNASTLELVAHYDLKAPGEPAYATSGNVLTVYEEFQNLAVELLASLIIMRHIAVYHL